ncbi:MAG: hypothetical protein K6T91_08800, partial [Firmicutes bacterium]|nr:hypothetical protein [Bacillota bacterium]
MNRGFTMLSRLSLTVKIATMLGLMVMPVIILSIGNLSTGSGAGHGAAFYRKYTNMADAAGGLQHAIGQSQMTVKDLVVTGDATKVQLYRQLQEQVNTKIADLENAVDLPGAKPVIALLKEDMTIANQKAQSVFDVYADQKTARQRVEDFDKAVSKASADADKIHGLVKEYETDLLGQTSSALRKANVVNLLALIMSLAFGVLTFFMIKTRVLQPTRYAFQKISKASKGLFDTLTEVTLNSEAIVNKNSEVVASVSQFSHGSERQVSSATEINQLVNQIATAVSQVAKGAQEQARDVAEANSMIEQLSTAVGDVVESAQTVARVASESLGTAEKGKQSVDEALSGMESMKDTVLDSANKIQTLGEKSKQIGEII